METVHNKRLCAGAKWYEKELESLIKRIELLTSLVPLAFYDGFNASNRGKYACSDDAFDDSAPIIQACYKK